MCKNAEKAITETENSRKMKIAEISISRKKRKLPKMYIPEITNSQNLKKRILKLPNLQNPENSILSNFQIPENSKLPNFQIPENSIFMNFKIPKKIIFNSKIGLS